MSWIDYSYKSKKVMTIGTVKELTGLTERRIRYYEERKLIFPERSKAGMRRYSFLDIELLAIISNKIAKKSVKQENSYIKVHTSQNTNLDTTLAEDKTQCCYSYAGNPP